MGTVGKFPTKEQEVRKTQGIGNPSSLVKKRLYSIPEAAEYLGRSVWSVRELIWGGKLPCIKAGRRIHLDIFDINQWIERNKVKTFL